MITEITILAEEDEILDTAAFPYFPVSGPPQNTAETLLDGYTVPRYLTSKWLLEMRD